MHAYYRRLAVQLAFGSSSTAILCMIDTSLARTYYSKQQKFKGEKFRGLLGSSGMWGKVLQFFPSPPSYIHGFPTLQNSYKSVSTKASRSSREFSY